MPLPPALRRRVARVLVLLPLLLPAIAAGQDPLPAAPGLPPMPYADGPLVVSVAYPRAGDRITARDTNFIFGSVGHGGAALRINGTPVRVWPNGSFLAWLPVPADGRYALEATRDTAVARDTHVVVVPERRPVPRIGGAAALEPESAVPAAGMRLARRADDVVRVGVRAAADARVDLRLPGGKRLPLSNVRVVAEAGGEPRTVRGTWWQADVPARLLGKGGRLVARVGKDTAGVRIAAVAGADTALPALVMLASGNGDVAATDTDRVVIARPTPTGTYAWFLLPGTIVPVTGRDGGMLRVQLATDREAWVSERDARALPAGAIVPARIAGNARLLNDSGWVDLVIPMAERPPHVVTVEGDRLVLTLLGTTGNSDIIAHRAGTQDVVRSVTATRDATDQVRYVVELTAPPFGWQAFWSGGAFVLRIRRPPAVDPARPLAGRRIVVDPGHPPLGSRGPTGFSEAVAVREVAERLARRLRDAGATVVLTRTDDAPLALGQRPVIARQANGEAFVSIHLNALPDGTNPFNPGLGSGTYWFHAPSAALAQAVQRGLVARMGLADEGTFFDNLAVVRQTWMPSVLTEGAYVMLPEHEAALRTSAFQEAYAAGIVDGLATFFRGLAR